MNPRQLRQIAEYYGLTLRRTLPMQKGYRNQSYPLVLDNEEIVNLIIYKQEPGIEQRVRDTNLVTNFLATTRQDIRHLADPRILRLSNSKDWRVASLYNYLPGKTIPWEAYTRRHIKLLGKTLAELHRDLLSSPQPQANALNQNLALLKQMHNYFEQPEVRRAMQQKLAVTPGIDFANFEKLLRYCERLPQQPLHLDFVRGNILFQGEGEHLRISGIVDFEKTAVGPPLLDVARTLAFLLVDSKALPEVKISKYFVASGYQKQGKQKLLYSQRDHVLLHELCSFYLLHDFYKFLCHNPYEYLHENQHYIRTRDVLQKRQRLSVEKA